MNHIDIAPNFSGILMGITNGKKNDLIVLHKHIVNACSVFFFFRHEMPGIANVMSILAPLLVGFVVTDNSDVSQWRIVFLIAAGVYFFGNLMFILFSSTEIQTWNDPEHRDRGKLLACSMEN